MPRLPRRRNRQIEHQRPVLVVGEGVGVVCGSSVYAARIDECARGASVLGEQAKVVADDVRGSCRIRLSSRRITAGPDERLGIGLERRRGYRAPVVRKHISPGPALAEPVSVPVANRNVVHPIARLRSAKRLKRRHHLPGAFEVPALARGEIYIAQELDGGGDY